MNCTQRQPKEFNLSVVHKLITDWASPNDAQRQPAEQAIEQFLLISNGEIDNFVMMLCQLLSHPQKTAPEVRIRIAILLRKRIAMKLDDESKTPIFCHLQSNTRKQTLRVLLKQLSSDPDKDTRNQIADCITELTTRTFTDLSKEYQSIHFMKSIFELYNLSDTNADPSTYNESLNVVNRINALQIFGHLCKWCPTDTVVQSNQSSIAQLYKVAFKEDTNIKVNIAALEAIQLTMKPLKPPAIFGFISLMFDVLKLLEHILNKEGQALMKKQQQNKEYTMDDDDYQQTQYILEIIIQIACDQPILFADHNIDNQTSPLLPFCTAFTQLAVTQHLPNKVRSLSLEFFLSLAENDPSFARKKQLIPKSIINICLDHFLLSQMDDTQWELLVYGEDEDHNDLSSIGEYALDRLVSALSADYVLPAIYNKLGLVNNDKQQEEGNRQYWNSNNWRNRHCALTVITQISDYIDNECPELIFAINKCLHLFDDNNYRIKYAVINTIGQLSNDHYDVIPDRFGDMILKHMLLCLSNKNHIKIETHCCAAMISFISSLTQKHIKQPLSALLNAVMNVLKNSNASWQQCAEDDMKRRNYQLAQEQALTAIAAIAQTAGDLFNEYYDVFAPVLMSIIKSAQSADLETVRCNAIQCMGCFGEAVGGDKFAEHAAELMNGTISFFKNRNVNDIADDPFIKTNISVWPRVLASIGNDKFYGYVATLCDILVSVANINIISNRNPEIQSDNFDFDAFEAKHNDDDNMAIIETDNGLIALDSAKMENKLAALFVMDALNEKYGAKMVDFMDSEFDALLKCIGCTYCFELRSESIKLAPRFIENIILGIRERANNATPQRLQSISEKLMTVLMSVLNEGRNEENNGLEGESACIGTAVKTLLQFINLIDPTDDDDYKPSQSVIRSFIDPQKLEFVIDTMFLCVIRAQHRIELYSKQEMNTSYDNIAKLEFEEEKEFEDDLLFNIAMILAEFIKIYRDDFLSILCSKRENMQKLVNFLNPANIEHLRNPQFIHKTGIYIICDIYEQCSVSATCQLLSHFMDQIMNIITKDDDAAVQQAAFYCLGLMVDKCQKNVKDKYICDILRLCMECITKHSNQYTSSTICLIDDNNELNEKRQFLGVIDNAMSAVCKILKVMNSKDDASLNIWFKHLPIKSDCVEAQVCHEYLLQLIQNKNPIIIGQNLANLPFVFKIFAQIRNTKLSSPKLDQIIGEFVSTICKPQPQFAQGLSLNEKRNLGL